MDPLNVDGKRILYFITFLIFHSQTTRIIPNWKVKFFLILLIYDYLIKSDLPLFNLLDNQHYFN